MAQQQQRSGKPYSGANPIPTIQKFVESLDKDKRERDREIDEQNKLLEKQHKGGVKPHQNTPKQTDGKTVTDPTTGKQVVIEDVGKDFMKAVRDPQVLPAQALYSFSTRLIYPCSYLCPTPTLGRRRCVFPVYKSYEDRHLSLSPDCKNRADAIQP